MTTKTYRVRKQVSGYSGRVTYYVVRNPGGWRLDGSTTSTRQCAQAQADGLNETFSTTSKETQP